MATTREMLAEERDGRVFLATPEVGTFTCAIPKGQLVVPGTDAGVIRTLGRTTSLVVPAGVSGRVMSDAPERVHEPVGYGQVLYELAPIEAGGASTAASDESTTSRDDNIFRCAHAGRFWHRPAPGEPALVEIGAVIAADEPIGLIEVMKTFGRVLYHPGGSLPERARVLRVLAADGAEVSPGDPLLEVEPA